MHLPLLFRCALRKASFPTDSLVNPLVDAFLKPLVPVFHPGCAFTQIPQLLVSFGLSLANFPDLTVEAEEFTADRQYSRSSDGYQDALDHVALVLLPPTRCAR
jgi:hypothetical protein